MGVGHITCAVTARVSQRLKGRIEGRKEAKFEPQVYQLSIKRNWENEENLLFPFPLTSQSKGRS